MVDFVLSFNLPQYYKHFLDNQKNRKYQSLVYGVLIKKIWFKYCNKLKSETTALRNINHEFQKEIDDLLKLEKIITTKIIHWGCLISSFKPVEIKRSPRKPLSDEEIEKNPKTIEWLLLLDEIIILLTKFENDYISYSNKWEAFYNSEDEQVEIEETEESEDTVEKKVKKAWYDIPNAKFCPVCEMSPCHCSDPDPG